MFYLRKKDGASARMVEKLNVRVSISPTK